MNIRVLLVALMLLSGCFEKGETSLEKGNMYTQIKSFDDISVLFPKTPEEAYVKVDSAISEVKRDIEKLLSISDRTFYNTVRELDRISANFQNKCNPLQILNMVSPDADICDACEKASIKAEQFAVDAFNNVEIYKAFKSYSIENKKEKLNEEEQYYLDESMKDFSRSGLDLPPDKLKEVNDIKKKLAKLSTEFDNNINQDKSSITVKKEELQGLDDDFINQLEKSGDDYILTCDYPIFFKVMDYCSVESTRKNLYLAFNNRAYPKNEEILKEVIDLRDQLAKKLGFKSYADLDIDSEMAKDSNNVKKFLLDLINKVQGKAKQELKELSSSDLIQTNLIELMDGKFKPWDMRYVKEIYKKEHFNIDERKIAEYFPMEKTVSSLFDIYQKFFSLTFKLSTPSWSWHPDVKLIEVYKQSNLVGYIFLDLYPRPNKYSHACHAGFIQAIADRPSAAVVIANFPKPTPGKPALLKYDDVLTFFHEFGHAMHDVLGRVELAGFSGTATKTDFVEMPSQMLEEWMWDKDILKKVSSHYETGDSLPEEMIDKMIELKRFDSGYSVLRQCILSLISLSMFEEGENKDPAKIVQDLYQRYFQEIYVDPRAHMEASFGHLMEYGAKYYSYMWSRVFALDMFHLIKEKGLLNPEAGAKLISEVLGKGGSRDPNLILETYLGRKPKQDAFLKDLGFR